jgi:ABC-2 type transport system permease protein
MHGTWVIFKRELRGYFTSAIAYLVAVAVLFLAGMVFNIDLRDRNGFVAADGTVILSFFSFAMVFLAPLLTMRLFAEETREGTLELLLTMPIRDPEIVLGKFLGAWAYYSLLLAGTLIYPLILVLVGDPDFGSVISGYIGAWLYGGALIAVGLLFSALTENQIVAAFLSITVLFALWLADSIGSVFANMGVALAQVIRTLSLRSHQSTSFMMGIVRPEDIVFYVGLMAVMLFIAAQVVASRRWRG